MAESKKWYKSKSIWVGVITLGWGVLEYFGVVNSGLTPETTATILGILVVVLRAITKDEISF